jgi:hypothetical protein
MSKRLLLLPLLLGSLLVGPFLARAAVGTIPTTIASGNEATVVVEADEDSQVYLFDPSGNNVNGNWSYSCGVGPQPANYVYRSKAPEGWATTWVNFPIGNAAGTYTIDAMACSASVYNATCGTGQTKSTCEATGGFRYNTTIAITDAPPAPSSTTFSVQGFIDDYGTPLMWFLASIVALGLFLGFWEVGKALQEEWHKRVV